MLCSLGGVIILGDFSKHLFSKKGYHVCYSKNNKNPYLVYNEYKPFNEGHTHVHTYEQACLIVDYAIARKIPKECNDYLLVSLLRITKDARLPLRSKIGHVIIWSTFISRYCISCTSS